MSVGNTEAPEAVVSARYHPTSIVIDGRDIDIRIKRLNVNEFSDLSRKRQRMSELESDRVALLRKLPDEFERHVPTEAEAEDFERRREELAAIEAETSAALAAMDASDSPLGRGFVALLAYAAGMLRHIKPEAAYRVPDEEIRRRRLSEMSPEQASRHRALTDEEDQFAASFIADTIAAYVTVLPKQIAILDEDTHERTPVTTGAQLVQIYGGRVEIIRRLFNEVWQQNTLSPEIKNALRPRSGSTSSSLKPAREVGGLTPDGAAAPAASVASASSDAATGSLETSLTSPLPDPQPASCGPADPLK